MRGHLPRNVRKSSQPPPARLSGDDGGHGWTLSGRSAASPPAAGYPLPALSNEIPLGMRDDPLTAGG
jgi:hypothetical protein